jgi:putative peptide zinc metalloprotease protein
MLPVLREELALYAGPPTNDGAPTWSLHDPVRNLFFRIDWLSFEMLSRWHLGDPTAILDAIADETPIEPQEEDFANLAKFLVDSELIQRQDAKSTTWLHEQLQKRRPKISQWLLHHYLFFRIPLWHPNAWLERTGPYVAFFFSAGFRWLTFMVLALGLMQVNRQWDVFKASLMDLFSWQGLLSYFVALVFVKFFHELGHAFTAKRYGCRVPTMGVAFLVLFPMAYTDVNEVWKLTDKHQRLKVGAAGILTELTIAAWSTLLWAMLPAGLVKDGVFLLASTTWISTLIINASPFLRFDGYFLLMDWLDMANLHQRAFAMGRWKLREWLFGLKAAPPEYFQPRRHWGLIFFAYGVWLYRLIVFGGIAIMVYILFPKPLGPFLAAVEIIWFILRPVSMELKVWWALAFPSAIKEPMMPELSQQASAQPNARHPGTGASAPTPVSIFRLAGTWRTLGVLALILAMLFIPWDVRLRSQGLLRPAEIYPLVSPGGARLLAIYQPDDTAVPAETPLMSLDVPDLDHEQAGLRARAISLSWQAEAVGVNPELRKEKQVIEASRQKVETELQGIAGNRGRYQPKAPFAGHFYLDNPDLAPDVWVEKNEQLGVVTDNSRWVVETYLPESQLGRLKVGDKAVFFSETPDVAQLDLRVERIDRDATRILTNGILASTRGGAVLVRETKGGPVPETAVYRVSLSVPAGYMPRVSRQLRGQVVFYGKPKAYMDEFSRAALALIMREAGF